jgi:hypothetical protein
MPIFRIQSPDGKTLEITAPEGATQKDVLAYAQANYKPSKPKPIDPTEGMSTTQKTLAGIGQGMTSLARGAGQRLGIIDQVEIDQAKQLDAPLLNTTSGTVGSIVGQGALAAPAALIPGANTYLGATALGAGLGALQPTGTDESVTQNMVLGAAGGAAGKYIGDKVGKLLVGKRGMRTNANATANIGPAQSKAVATATGGANARVTGGGAGYGSVGDDVSAGLNEAQKRVMRSGTNMGFKMTPGQATGSRALQQFEAKLESQPMTSGAFNEIKANNQKVLNRVGASAIGETSDTLDSSTLSKALDRISGTYKLVANDKPRTINPDDFLQRLGKVESDYEGLLPASISDNPLVKRLYGLANNGEATGRQLQDLASKLGKAANNQMTSGNGDRQVGMALFEVKDMVDDLLEQGLTGKTLKKFSEARGQYRNLMLLTQRNGVINPSSGDLSGNALAGLLQQKDRKGFLFGNNNSELYDAARFAQAFRPIVGDSGTATRSMVMNPTDYVLSLPFSLMTKAYTSSPAVNLAVGANAVGRNGVAPFMNQNLVRSLPQTGAIGGGLLGANYQ